MHSAQDGGGQVWMKAELLIWKDGGDYCGVAGELYGIWAGSWIHYWGM